MEPIYSIESEKSIFMVNFTSDSSSLILLSAVEENEFHYTITIIPLT